MVGDGLRGRPGSLVALACLVLVGMAALGGSSAAPLQPNEPPLPDAGLDQTVPVNATVILDAGSSRDPDGTITDYEWSIERPDGNHTQPRCPSCALTEFQVGQTGTYNATVTVTDDDGAERSDTMKIHVHSVDGPTVSLAGPTGVVANRSSTYTATMAAGDADLVRVDWYVDGDLAARNAIEGQSATNATTVRLRDLGSHTVEAQVYDVLGRTQTASLDVNVTAPEDPPCTAATWNETAQRWNAGPCGPDGAGPTGNGNTTYNGTNGGPEIPPTATSFSATEVGYNDDSIDTMARNNYGGTWYVVFNDVNGDGEVHVNGIVFTAGNLEGTTRSVKIPVSQWEDIVYSSPCSGAGVYNDCNDSDNDGFSGTIVTTDCDGDFRCDDSTATPTPPTTGTATKTETTTEPDNGTPAPTSTTREDCNEPPRWQSVPGCQDFPGSGDMNIQSDPTGAGGIPVGPSSVLVGGAAAAIGVVGVGFRKQELE